MEKVSKQLLTVENTKNMFEYIAHAVIREKPLLTEIDSAIGDGDHGIGMEVGFKNSLKLLEEKSYTNVNEIFKDIGMSMINNMGGASGVLFGTFFLGSVKGEENVDALNLEKLAHFFEKGLNGVKQRGKAAVGDKTMIDALEPAINALKKKVSETDDIVEGMEYAAICAEQGLESTKYLVAKFGRAKTLGERALGHQDAGATTIMIMFKSMHEWLSEKE
ncbi:MAG: dihydroxyacetone kinase subunit DhaL [Lysinibacillus sp.]